MRAYRQAFRTSNQSDLVTRSDLNITPSRSWWRSRATRPAPMPSRLTRAARGRRSRPIASCWRCVLDPAPVGRLVKGALRPREIARNPRAPGGDELQAQRRLEVPSLASARMQRRHLRRHRLSGHLGGVTGTTRDRRHPRRLHRRAIGDSFGAGTPTSRAQQFLAQIKPMLPASRVSSTSEPPWTTGRRIPGPAAPTPTSPRAVHALRRRRGAGIRGLPLRRRAHDPGIPGLPPRRGLQRRTRRGRGPRGTGTAPARCCPQRVSRGQHEWF
jgi:hypothetical protein